MDGFAKLLKQLNDRLRGISLSQRVALLLGAALVGVSLVWLANWAATPEMVPLLPQDLQSGEIAQITSGLDRANTAYRVSGGKVLVPASANRSALLAQLQQDDRLPSNVSSGFAALVKESNPFISEKDNERRWTVALQEEIANVLRRFAGVREAHVFLNLNAPRRSFARYEAPASASVTLIMKNGEPVSRALALSAARLVSGAVRGVQLKNVNVVDGNGASALDWTDEDASSALHRERQTQERELAEKIHAQLSDPRAKVSVQVELDHTARSATTETPVAGVETSTERTSDRIDRGSRGGQPGVEPNVALAAGNAGAEESSIKETEHNTYKPGAALKQETTAPGSIVEIFAAVNISASYLESIFRRANPDAQTPTDAQLDEVFERERLRVVAQVTKLVKPQKEDHVAVSWYWDQAVANPPGQADGTSGALNDAVDVARRYGPQSGLALLALLSVGLMLRMARKSDGGESFGLELGLPREAVEAARKAAADVAVHVSRPRPIPTAVVGTSGSVAGSEGISEVISPGNVGQAAATEGVLIGQEVDETTVQTHKMLEQVTQLVETDAESASSLLEQWMQRNDNVFRHSGG